MVRVGINNSGSPTYGWRFLGDKNSAFNCAWDSAHQNDGLALADLRNGLHQWFTISILFLKRLTGDRFTKERKRFSDLNQQRLRRLDVQFLVLIELQKSCNYKLLNSTKAVCNAGCLSLACCFQVGADLFLKISSLRFRNTVTLKKIVQHNYVFKSWWFNPVNSMQ